jgi:potassium-transporting ATPase KdpC subunit
MNAHLRANLWLLGLTLALCSVLYPLALWGVGRAAFPAKASGSLVTDPDGMVRGSALIAQPFNDAKYFQPRPSAASYNAAASGASNWGASQPLLRDRVARQLGPMVRYAEGEKAGQRVGPDVESWFRANPGLLGTWAEGNSTLAARWVKDDANRAGVARWLADHPDLLKAWREANPSAGEPDADRMKDLSDDLAAEVLKAFASEHPGAWPVPKKRKGQGGQAEDYLDAVRPDPAGKEEITDLQAVLFDAWLQAHPEIAGRLKKVPADMVMASGSGLDPHISLRNALYQLDDHVAEARAKETGRDPERVRKDVEAILRKHAFTPLAGEPLINVLEVNRALDAELRPASGR